MSDLGNVATGQEIYLAIDGIRAQLNSIERNLIRLVPRPTPTQVIAIKLRELKEKSNIDQDWLKQTSAIASPEEETSRLRQTVDRENQQIDMMMPTHFVVSFRNNPGLRLGSCSDTINGVWFSVVGSHPITGMPIIACHGSMESGSIGTNLREALNRGFDGQSVDQQFDVRLWDSLDGTWRMPQFDHPMILE